jgi:hypothetical protein
MLGVLLVVGKGSSSGWPTAATAVTVCRPCGFCVHTVQSFRKNVEIDRKLIEITPFLRRARFGATR